MIHQTNAFETAPWHSVLKAGDIVAFRFPHETEGSEAPKVRPTLVLDIEVQGGKRYAVLAYGTSNKKTFPRREAYAVDVNDDAEIAAASLCMPTRFHGARRLMVSLENGGFAVHAGKKTALLGQLTGRSLARLHAVRARICAERDIRREALIDRRRKIAAPRPVSVEYRGKGRTRQEQRYV